MSGNGMIMSLVIEEAFSIPQENRNEHILVIYLPEPFSLHDRLEFVRRGSGHLIVKLVRIPTVSHTCTSHRPCTNLQFCAVLLSL
eukprot:COSAG02_NODE_4929_length_4821_cov_7.778060_9_plen_85_part_00